MHWFLPFALQQIPIQSLTSKYSYFHYLVFLFYIPVSTCGYLTPPENGNKEGIVYLNGSSVTLTCNNGYKLSGSSDRKCVSGAWSGNVTICGKFDLIWTDLFRAIKYQSPITVEKWTKGNIYCELALDSSKSVCQVRDLVWHFYYIKLKSIPLIFSNSSKPVLYYLLVKIFWYCTLSHVVTAIYDVYH